MIDNYIYLWSAEAPFLEQSDNLVRNVFFWVANFQSVTNPRKKFIINEQAQSRMQSAHKEADVENFKSPLLVHHAKCSMGKYNWSARVLIKPRSRDGQSFSYGIYACSNK